MLTVYFPKYFKTSNSEDSYTMKFSADSGTLHTELINLRVLDTISSLIEASVSISNAPSGYINGNSQYLTVTYIPGDYRLFTSTTQDSAYYGSRFTRFHQLRLLRPVAPGQTRMRSINISGTVYFHDPHQLGDSKGLYGTKIELYFAKSSDPSTLYWPSLDYIQHMQYDIIQNNGSYYFSFGTRLDLSPYDRIVLLVRNTNDYIEMESQDGFIVNATQGTFYTYGLGEGALIPYNPSSYSFSLSNEAIQIEGKSGAIFRNLEISGEAVKEIYSGNVPFSQPLVMVQIIDLANQGYAGLFYLGGWYGLTNLIQIDPNYTDATTTDHEFGHNVNSNMYGDDYNHFNSNGHNMIEGWAEYFSFFARNYASAVYSDDFREYDSNMESAPFQSPRFSNMRYHNEPDVCKFACYLWNIYDQYSSANFKSIMFQDADNDDFGSTSRPFEVMRNMINGDPTTYNNQFKSPLQSDEMNSVQKIYDDMYVSSTTKMLPPQVNDNATATLVNSSAIDFAWNSQAYEYWAPYKNLEENYNIYKQTAIGNTWVLCATVSSSIYYYTYSYQYSCTSANKYNYKLTSSNSSGDACHSKIFYFDADPQLTASIEGPDGVHYPYSGNYSASVSGGNGTFSYQWYISYNYGSTWINEGTGSSMQFTPNWLYYEVTLRLDVTSGLQQVTTTRLVDLVCPHCNDKSVNLPMNQVNFYPNPTSGEVFCDYMGNANIFIYDIAGQILKSISNFSGNSINLCELPSGLYLIRVVQKEGKDQSDRILITK